MKRLFKTLPGAALLLLVTSSATYAQEVEPRAQQSEPRAQQSEPEQQIFFAPTYRGYRLDWCLVWSEHCGLDAAHVFCLSNGYWTAQSFAAAEHVGTTMLIGTNQLCDAWWYDSFTYIICE